ncbi:MAG: DUF2600 family protein [Bacillota bacterium]|nr:DUF2600 family protein [Bacillota bacterium]
MRHWLLVSDLMYRAFPAVDRRLARYLELAGDRGIRRQDGIQARLSILTKRFHCQGGAAFACLSPARQALLDAIVALQTMSDYLDNLCDRRHPPEESRFRMLHGAMRAAVAPGPSGSHPPWLAQDRLLSTLVADCHRALTALPSHPVIHPEVSRLVNLYCDLQSYKHLPPGQRESALVRWQARQQGEKDPVGQAARDLSCHEFAAACGSTLGIFALFRLAAQPRLTRDRAGAVVQAYFPHICGLHILLDYLIDMDEDRASGDLNFVLPYGSRDSARARLIHFVRRALEKAGTLPDAWFHRLVVKGLLAMYLSDPKLGAQELEGFATNLLRAAGPPAAGLWRLCLRLRRRGIIPPNSWQPVARDPKAGTTSGSFDEWKSGT